MQTREQNRRKKPSISFPTEKRKKFEEIYALIDDYYSRVFFSRYPHNKRNKEIKKGEATRTKKKLFNFCGGICLVGADVVFNPFFYSIVHCQLSDRIYKKTDHCNSKLTGKPKAKTHCYLFSMRNEKWEIM